MGKKDKPVRKNIDLPLGSVEVLSKLAEARRMKVKPYMELILIEHAQKKSILKET